MGDRGPAKIKNMMRVDGGRSQGRGGDGGDGGIVGRKVEDKMDRGRMTEKSGRKFEKEKTDEGEWREGEWRKGERKEGEWREGEWKEGDWRMVCEGNSKGGKGNEQKTVNKRKDGKIEGRMTNEDESDGRQKVLHRDLQKASLLPWQRGGQPQQQKDTQRGGAEVVVVVVVVVVVIVAGRSIV